MKIINETAYRTEHLRAFIQRVLLDEVDPPQRRAYRFTIKYARANARTIGHASYSRPVVTLLLKRPPAVEDKVVFAHIIAHELAHTKGLRHPQMRSPRYAYVGAWREAFAWAEGLPLELAPPKAAPTREQRLERRLTHARAKLARWERAERLARGRVRRWRGRVRDYTRYLEHAAAQAPTLIPHPLEGVRNG